MTKYVEKTYKTIQQQNNTKSNTKRTKEKGCQTIYNITLIHFKIMQSDRSELGILFPQSFYLSTTSVFN